MHIEFVMHEFVLLVIIPVDGDDVLDPAVVVVVLQIEDDVNSVGDESWLGVLGDLAGHVNEAEHGVGRAVAVDRAAPALVAG